ncbi:hypothetical protein [Embleya sp. NPDC059237]|uniref:hypothetical protein n=1 Tax=Embleya sp. NPDC059237 TaxID=3346784 RepID=UPI0036CF6A68
MNTPSRALAAGLVVAAALTGCTAAAAPAPDAGTTVVVTGDDRYVVADHVVVRHNPSAHSAAVEIVHRGDVHTVQHTSTAAAEPSGLRAEHEPEPASVDPGAPRAEGTPMLTTP